MFFFRAVKEYYETGYTDAKGREMKPYTSLIAELQEKFPIGERITSEQAMKEFVKLYGAILKLRNILTTFDEFEGKGILTERDVQDYHSMYIDIYNTIRPQHDEQTNVNDDIVFEMELIKQVEINIDYILMLIKKYHDTHMKDKEIIITIQKSIDASMELRSKKDLILSFISSLTPSSKIDSDWKKYVQAKKMEELDELIAKENLNKEETYKFIDAAFRNGYVQEIGTDIDDVLPPTDIFAPNDDRYNKRMTVLEKIKSFFNRFKDVSNGKL